MRGNNFHHANISGRSISPQVVGVATVNGVTISEPWRDGRQITFLLIVGVVTGDITFHWEVQERGTTTWKDLMDNADTPVDVEVTFDSSADDTQLEATIALKDIDSDTYDAIRIQVTGTNAADAASCSHVISDLYERPGGDANALPGAFTMPFTYEA